MNRQRSFEQYRTIDLSFLFVILLVFESIIVLASGTWFPNQAYTVSIAAAVTAIVMVRWGAWSAVYAAAAGVILCVISKASWQQYVIYCGGNLLSLAALPVMKLITWERIRKDAVTAVLFGILVQLLMQAGRAGIAICLGYPAKDCIGFFSTDSLSMLFTMVLIWIARRQDGMLEDQRAYIHRLKEEERAERGLQE